MMRVAQIARENLDEESVDTLRTLSIWFIAGRTVARLGMPQEKNIVASLKT
jgi:hypothetical protein